jgi:hypothetical protein
MREITSYWFDVLREITSYYYILIYMIDFDWIKSFYLFCSSIVTNTVIVTAGTFEQ